jgi:hypothetical protein
MARNQMKATLLRPVLAVLALGSLLALGGCGGGSGAPNNPFAPGPVAPGPLFVLPPSATVYTHTPATLSVSGGASPYQAFSSNSAILPVAQAVNGSTIVLLANDVGADTVAVITIQDAIGQTATSTVTVRPAPIFNTLTITPARTACGANTVCSGDTATAAVQVIGVGGAGIPNRAVRFDVVTGAFSILTNNPATPFASTLTVVSDSNGNANVVIQASVGVPTQPAVIRATEVTTGNTVTGAFTIVQSTDGSAILSVVPSTASISGPNTATCSSGFKIDYYIYGGTAPYHVASTFPSAVGVVNSTVSASGGFFEAVTNGTCVDPNVFTIVDSVGRQTTAQLSNVVGTATVPTPPTPPTPTAVVITPTAVAATSCAGKTFSFVITGGTPTYSVTTVSNPGPSTGVVTPASGVTAGTPVLISGLTAAGVTTVIVVDQSSPQKSVTATITCT